VLHHGTISHDWALHSGLASDSKFSWDIAVSGMPFFLLNGGDFAVCLFLGLSGFVLAHSFLHSSLGVFASAIKRYTRLTVPIVVANLISLAVGILTPGFALPGTTGIGRSLLDLIGALRFCLVEAFYKATFVGLHGASYNSVLWTIPIEFQGSLLLLFVFAATRRIARTPSRWSTTAGIACFVLFLLTWHSRLGLFGAGATLYALFAADRLRPLEHRGVWVAALVVLALFLGTMPESPERISIYNALIRLVGDAPEVVAGATVGHPLPTFLGLHDPTPYRLSAITFWHSMGAILILWAVFLSRTIMRVLNHGFCQWLGRLSFPLYLIHSTVYRTVGLGVYGWVAARGVTYGVSSLIAIAVYTLASLAAADVLARTVERAAVRRSGELGQWIDTRWRRKPLGISNAE
jgi:peptidoglycan/LPS O-acetylase OafA/YrhL